MKITAHTAIITTCTNRKRQSPDAGLHARDLIAGTTAQVGTDWRDRLSKASLRWKANDLYLGRGFSDAKAAAQSTAARLYIVSAGLGLVGSDTLVPSYDLTVTPNVDGSILSKTTDTARAWWVEVETAIEPAPVLEGGLILAALSRPYLEMVSASWSQWPEERLERLRLFSKEKPVGFGDALLNAWMPYDDRLDQYGGGAYAGTQGDFAQRALRHFVSVVGTAPQHAEAQYRAVRLSLEGLDRRERPDRDRLDDESIKSLIQRDWTLVDGRSGAMLRHLRDTLGIACEQGRFKDLFHQVANGRGGMLL